ncbi:MAG: lysylphosphatidylglycerol synthase domain-containing protein [Betaproteobacteria bacterium]
MDAARALWERHRARLRRLATAALLLLALVLLWERLRGLDAADVLRSLRGFPPAAWLAAAALTASSYAVYCSFDLLGKRYAGHRLSRQRVLEVSFVSYAFNLNFGLAGLALRYRLYSMFGQRAGVVARVYAICLGTNWLGFAALAGGMLASGLLALPAGGPLGVLGDGALRALGLALVAGTLAWLALCGLSRRRAFTLFGHRIALPSLGFALAQCTLSVANWLLIAAVVAALLPRELGYAAVLGTTLLGAMALMLVDVPGGLGVTEAVFLAALGSRVPAAQLLAGLAAYRLVYFVGPLLPAALVYLGLEAKARERRKTFTASLR